MRQTTKLQHPIYGIIFESIELEDGLQILLDLSSSRDLFYFFSTWETIERNGFGSTSFEQGLRLYYDPKTDFLDVI